jgi:hypothetical protein
VLDLVIKLYADETENFLEVDGVQRKVGAVSVEIRVLRIAWAEKESNKEVTAGTFHLERVGSIKSRIRRALRFLLNGNLGKGLKEGREGTQFVDQIDTVEFLDTVRQAPAEMRGLIF